VREYPLSNCGGPTPLLGKLQTSGDSEGYGPKGSMVIATWLWTQD
jgi:hypothetical protein